MKIRSFNLFSLAALVISLVAWAGVWFLFSDLSTRLANRAQELTASQSANSKQANVAATHVLAADTVVQRGQLDTAVAADVVGIAAQINAAGKAAGVQTTIGSASVVGTSAAAGVSQLEFEVQATGSFAQVWRAAQLFQTLPLASQVSELDFEESPNSGKGNPVWQLTAHISVLTSTQV